MKLKCEGERVNITKTKEEGRKEKRKKYTRIEKIVRRNEERNGGRRKGKKI